MIGVQGVPAKSRERRTEFHAPVDAEAANVECCNCDIAFEVDPRVETICPEFNVSRVKTLHARENGRLNCCFSPNQPRDLP